MTQNYLFAIAHDGNKGFTYNSKFSGLYTFSGNAFPHLKLKHGKPLCTRFQFKGKKLKNICTIYDIDVELNTRYMNEGTRRARGSSPHFTSKLQLAPSKMEHRIMP